MREGAMSDARTGVLPQQTQAAPCEGEARTLPAGTNAASEDIQPTAGPAVWGFTTVGVLLFFLAHGSILFTRPVLFLAILLIWGILFGIPARILNRNRMRRGLTTVAVLFFSAAAYDAIVEIQIMMTNRAVQSANLNASPTVWRTTTRTPEPQIIDPETGETIDPITDPLGAAKVLSIRHDRPLDVPDVRIQMKSDNSGYLHGTVYNDTRKRIEKLRLSIRTGRWTRIHDVKVQVEPNTTETFTVSIGDASLDVKSFSVLK
jgi:hypothetical protein